MGGGYLATLYDQTRNAIKIDVNGAELVHYTQRRAVEDIFRELGVELGLGRRARASLERRTTFGTPIRLSIARRVFVTHDGSLDRSADAGQRPDKGAGAKVALRSNPTMNCGPLRDRSSPGGDSRNSSIPSAWVCRHGSKRSECLCT